MRDSVIGKPVVHSKESGKLRETRIRTPRDNCTSAIIMARDIRPLCSKDLPELSQFLAAGFQARPDADFAAPAVLRWKYLEPIGFGSSISSESDTWSTNQSLQDQSIDSRGCCHAPLSYVAIERVRQNCRSSWALSNLLRGQRNYRTFRPGRDECTLLIGLDHRITARLGLA